MNTSVYVLMSGIAGTSDRGPIAVYQYPEEAHLCKMQYAASAREFLMDDDFEIEYWVESVRLVPGEELLVMVCDE